MVLVDKNILQEKEEEEGKPLVLPSTHTPRSASEEPRFHKLMPRFESQLSHLQFGTSQTSCSLGFASVYCG